ncbi:calmodulin-binding protein 60 D [Eucalyptus grandis]|uniref:calmodulin-binding protein 60 D n=1 Tax=Eucalyptus grandis TaxID=71139 RepID=UPI00192E9D70|nr:calmodulin-binding protein 60 D [Eucalyptus grandis]
MRLRVREELLFMFLVDPITGSLVQSGPSAMLKLMVTVIGGDFHEEASKNWTREFFWSNELLEREDKMPLLTGDLPMILDKGMGTLGAVTFNDVSSWTRSGKFRLAVKTALGHSEGIRVLEGISNAFTVEDGKRADPNIYGDRLWTPEGIDMSKVLYTETANALVDVGENVSLQFPRERGPLRSVRIFAFILRL